MPQLRDGLHILWAIVAKDIVDAARNKTVQGVAIGVLLIVLPGRMFVWLAGLQDGVTVIAYDPGRSDLVSGLRRVDGVRLHGVRSVDEMVETVAGSPLVTIGLQVPDDVDQALQDGHSLALSAQFPHWASWAEMTDTKLYLQQGLSEVAGQSVQIAVQEERIYPQLGGQGFSSLLGGVTTITILTMGVFLAPHLLVEERQSRTMDALLVSPASIAQIVASKAFVGTLSCVASAAVALALYRAFVVHWAVAVLGALAGAFFAVMAGLVFGSFFRTLQGQSVAMGLGLALVAVLPFVADAALGRYPLFEAVAPWLPPIALFRLSHMALVGTVPVTSLWSSTGVLLGSGALALALLVWRVRRLGR